MDVESLAKQLILQNMSPEQQTAVLDGIKASLAQAKEVQKRKIGENVGVVVQALKKIESDIRERYDELGNVIEKRVASIKDGKDGKNGQDGRNGKDGRPGRDGAAGAQGQRGQDGTNGRDGTDGVSVVDAHIDFDGSLIIGLSSGRVINVGEVVAPDLAEKIKVITNGGGTSQTVLDTLASLQTQINTLIPSQTGNSGKFLTTNGTTTSWSSVAGGLSYQGTWNASTNTPTLASGVGVNGYYYITATAGSTNLDGITDWQIGDWLMFNGSVWQKIDQSNLVTSVAGKTGAVTLTTADVSGLNTMSVQAANNVSITGGSITGITDLAVADGGTGASTAANARTNLGLVIGTDVLAPNGSAASLTSFPTLNQNTTGTASNVTGVVAVANGGTGVATTTANFIFAGPSSGSPAAPTFRALTTADIPALSYGTGSVTSVALSLPSIIAVTGSPVTSSGTLTGTLTTQAANAIFAGPSSGAGAAPTFRSLTTADIPSLSYVTSVAASVPAFLSISGSPITSSGTLAISYSGTALPIANGGTGQTTAGAAFNALSPVTTTGDLILGNGTNSATRLAIGTNAYVLTSNGTTASWAAPITNSKIQPITASVASNALTVTLNPTTLDFRATPLTSGTVNTRTVGSAISVVVSSGSTLGTVSAQQSRIVVLALDNSGTIELAVVNISGGTNLDETTLISTTAEGGAGAADSATVVYSTTARTSLPFRVVGYVESTQATAGTWATAPSTIQGYGGQALAAMSSLGYGQTWQTFTSGTRPVNTTFYNTTGRPISVQASITSNTAGDYPVITINGIIQYWSLMGAVGTVGAVGGIVPPNGSYSVATNSGVATFHNWRELR